ncbi:hypothetical protein, partial [Phaeobacter italicus]|uniref:hypothetical protein n=1 Tax=Phaeobacter italicus TaxID=481446 RepID=UPI001A9491EC
FAVVNVADGADVDVRFCTLKLFLSHSVGALLNWGSKRDPVFLCARGLFGLWTKINPFLCVGP